MFLATLSCGHEKLVRRDLPPATTRCPACDWQFPVDHS